MCPAGRLLTIAGPLEPGTALERYPMPTVGHRALGRTTLTLISAILLICLTAWVTGRVLNFEGYLLPAEKQERVRQLEEERVRTLRRVQARWDVIAAVITRRMTLLDAAGTFRALNREMPSPFWATFRHNYVGGSDDERHCQQVIGFVCTELE